MQVGQTINVALSLDDEGRHNEAFSNYMQCIGLLAQKLHEGKIYDDNNKEIFCIKNSRRMFSMLRQCVDRAEQLLTAETDPRLANLQETYVGRSPSGSFSEGSSPGSPGSSLSLYPLPPPSSGGSSTTILSYDFVHEAKLKNFKLKKNYQQRLANSSPSERSNLELILLRAMNENINIAKSKQSQLNQQLEARKHLETEHQQKIMEMRAKAAAAHQKPAPVASTMTAQTFSSDTFSNSDQELKLFVQTASDVNQLSPKLEQLFKSESNPFGRQLREFVASMEGSCIIPNSNDYTVDQLQGKLESVVQTTHSFIDSIRTLWENMFHEVPSDWQDDAEIIMDNIILSSVYPSLMNVYVQRFAGEDQELMRVSSAFSVLTPADLGIKPKFWLLPREADENIPPSSVPPPYTAAIKAFQGFSSITNACEKALCIANTCKQIVASISEFWRLRGLDPRIAELTVGADDLLPILCFVMIKSGERSLQAQTAFLVEFIHHSLLAGEEAYAVATIETALPFMRSDLTAIKA